MESKHDNFLFSGLFGASKQQNEDDMQLSTLGMHRNRLLTFF